MDGFKKFLLQGNLVELAVAFIIGTAFAAVVTAFTDLLVQLVTKVFGANDVGAIILFDDVNLAPFINAVIAFVTVAAVVYFLVVTPYTKAKERFFPDEPEAEAPEVVLLTQIRDSLASR